MDLRSFNIGVLMGGFSSEKDVSLRSGENVYKTLKAGGYNVYKIDVGNDFIDSIKDLSIDIAFNVLHGYFGEDGRIQAILDFLGVAYTGSGYEASFIGINKVMCKIIAQMIGVKTAEFKLVNKIDDIYSFGYPCIVKPINEGSSIGVTLIESNEDLDKFKNNFKPNNFFVERFIKGKEITVGLLDNGDTLIKLPILQLVPKNRFYDYEAKYVKGMTDFILPAELTKEEENRAYDYALKVHKHLGCLGATRSDFIVGNDDIYFLEINTNPGMTDTSDIPAQAKAYGMSMLQLCEFILSSSLKRLNIEKKFY
ncbi:MAG TPA: D-alanine--D-alanine ligase [Spirochaetota bacterium]|nr:D-alanine--D-alanine ligase [Spirochaetota bacterium]HOM39031.1 D-alanine--D-alanine ligase [Spirochaetota bacterium]HPQ49916.1 D-alanine--D-alanine ligase [Spirochaetota bacterium]